MKTYDFHYSVHEVDGKLFKLIECSTWPRLNVQVIDTTPDTFHPHATLLKHCVVYDETGRGIGLRSFAILTQEAHITQCKVVHQSPPIHLWANHYPIETVLTMI